MKNQTRLHNAADQINSASNELSAYLVFTEEMLDDLEKKDYGNYWTTERVKKNVQTLVNVNMKLTKAQKELGDIIENVRGVLKEYE